MNVSDLTFVGITRLSGTNTITDELTSSTTPLTDAHVGMYLIGQPVQSAGSGVGYSRFTTSTSTNFPTWIVGPEAPPPQIHVSREVFTVATVQLVTVFRLPEPFGDAQPAHGP